MNSNIRRIVDQLLEIKDDVEAIDHHQTDRIVREIEQVVVDLRQLAGLEPS